MKKHFHTDLPNIAFIVGMGRSGTTMLTSMLNMNEQIIATPENEFTIFSYSYFKSEKFSSIKQINFFATLFNYDFNNVINIWKPKGLVNKIENLKDKTFANVCKLVYLSYPLSNKINNDVKWVIDKNPSYSLQINTLQKIYPEAKYILIVRDYRDNIVSRKKYSDKNSSIYKLAAAWNYYYSQIFKAISKHKLPHFIVKYEDLVQFPEKTLREICFFLDVEYNANMLKFQDFSKEIKKHAQLNLSDTKFEKVSNMHSNLDKEVNTERVEAFKKELTVSEIEILDLVCSKHAKTFNYKPISGNSSINFFKKIKYSIAFLEVVIFDGIKKTYYSLPLKFRLLFKKTFD